MKDDTKENSKETKLKNKEASKIAATAANNEEQENDLQNNNDEGTIISECTKIIDEEKKQPEAKETNDSQHSKEKTMEKAKVSKVH